MRYGINAIKIDGQKVEVRGSAEIKLGAEEREPILGVDNEPLKGYAVRRHAPMIDADISFSRKYEWILEIKDSSVVVDLEDGTSFFLNNAFSKNSDGFNWGPEEGTGKLELVGSTGGFL